LLKPLAGSTATPNESAADLATTHNNLGLVLEQMQAKDSAAGEFRQAIALQESLLKQGGEDRTVLRSLAASYNNLASLQENSDPRTTGEMYEKAVALQMKLVIADPINRNHQADLARTYNNLGFLASRNKDWPRAELWYADAIRLQENLVKESPLAGTYRRDLAISYNNLGMAQSRANKFEEAEASFQKAARSQDMLLVAQPNDAEILSNQGSVWNNLGMLYDQQQKPTDAAAAYQQAIHFQSAALKQAEKNDAYRATLSRHYFNYARNLSSQEKFEASLNELRELKVLWSGNAERLYAVAQEMAKLDGQMAGKTSLEKTKSDCMRAAIATLKEALAGGLSKDHLSDASLASLSESPEFRQLTADSKIRADGASEHSTNGI
jgi:tetratricopeptide (TPR) repeat protein